jgi:hypothetical protein
VAGKRRRRWARLVWRACPLSCGLWSMGDVAGSANPSSRRWLPRSFELVWLLNCIGLPRLLLLQWTRLSPFGKKETTRLSWELALVLYLRRQDRMLLSTKFSSISVVAFAMVLLSNLVSQRAGARPRSLELGPNIGLLRNIKKCIWGKICTRFGWGLPSTIS